MSQTTHPREASTSTHGATTAPDPVVPARLEDAHASSPTAHLTIAQIPRSPDLLRCRFCGLPAREHGRHLIHRFLRPLLPDGYHYLDQITPGDLVSLHSQAFGDVILVAGAAGRAAAPTDELLLHSPRHDCFFVLHPSTVVADCESRR